ncbi:MAG: alpha/beta fold hydrolase [Ignavibacteriae bacterium]|nr:alpha/beta fold hydrolase [Ignavibacteriota bacterium]
MQKIFLTLLIIVFFVLNISAQTGKNVILETSTGNLEGSLLVTPIKTKMPVALIMAGSGPTDRDGNNPMMTNNSLKLLALGLEENGIASLRYDKRGIGKSKDAGLKEIDLRFENYVDDAESWIDYLRKDSSFSEIIVIGHSEGSLIGMIAANNKKADKFISLAGAGESANKIIKRQLASQPPTVLEPSLEIIAKLEAGETTDDVPQMLTSIFRPSVQPYIISWFKYDPQIEIAKLKIPVLIVQGTTDLQVTLDDAEKLAKANSNAKLQIIEGMNHILKEADMDNQKNIATYSNPELPLKDGLIDLIVEFIKK